LCSQVLSRPTSDIIMWSETGNKLIMIELTVPWETRCEEAYERKKAKYTELLIECRERGYRTWLFPIEVGARGFCSQSVCRLMAAIGTTGRDRCRTIQRLSQAAERASSWLWLRHEEKSWKLSTSTPLSGGATRYQIYIDKARNIYDDEHHADDGGR